MVTLVEIPPIKSAEPSDEWLRQHALFTTPVAGSSTALAIPLTRPTTTDEQEVTMIWLREEWLVDLVRSDEGLKFAYIDPTAKAITYSPEFNMAVTSSPEPITYQTTPWVGGFSVGDAGKPPVVRLASEASPYGSLEQLALGIRQFIHTYVDLTSEFESVATLYVLMTWVYERFRAVPYLRFLGGPATGKSRATETIGALCNRGLWISGAASSASLYRMIEVLGGTLLVDESDFREASEIGTDIAKIFNAGYQQGTPVIRMSTDPETGKMIPAKFDVFGPKIINGRKRFADDATETRCLSFTPLRTQRKDIPVQLTPQFEEEALKLRNQALAWRFDTLNLSAWPIPSQIEGVETPRTNQISQPLLQIVERMAADQSAAYRADLASYLLASEQQAKVRSLDSAEGMLLKAFVDTLHAVPRKTCGELAAEVGYKDLHLKMNSRIAGQMFTSMGFTMDHTRRGSAPSIDKDKLDTLLIQFGLG